MCFMCIKCHAYVSIHKYIMGRDIKSLHTYLFYFFCFKLMFYVLLENLSNFFFSFMGLIYIYFLIIAFYNSNIKEKNFCMQEIDEIV